jgi:hypothetical protein
VSVRSLRLRLNFLGSRDPLELGKANRT